MTDFMQNDMPNQLLMSYFSGNTPGFKLFGAEWFTNKYLTHWDILLALVSHSVPLIPRNQFLLQSTVTDCRQHLFKNQAPNVHFPICFSSDCVSVPESNKAGS